MELSQTGITAVLMAGKVVSRLWSVGFDGDWSDFKEEDGDTPVTVIDRESEKAIFEIISRSRPEDVILSEEGAEQAGESGVSWHIDPFDGTSNFMIGLPHSVIGLAAFLGGEPVVSVVCDPFAKILYVAEKGQGARKYGIAEDFLSLGDCKPLRVKKGLPWKKRFLLVDSLFNSETAPNKSSFIQVLANEALPYGAMNVRSLGSNILYGAMVADGQAQIALTDAVGGFHDAAATLLVLEAGGDVFDVDGRIPRPGCQAFLATNGEYRDELLEYFQHWYADYRGFR